MAKLRVLVVEDEGIVAKGIQNMLHRLGYDVLGVVSSGTDAIKKAAETHPDVVLMDIVLEGDVDGIEAAEQIRVRFGIPIIYLTAYADEKTLQRAKLTEPYGYIIKPFNESELHAVIEMAFHKHMSDRAISTAVERPSFNHALKDLADTKGVNFSAVVSPEGIMLGYSGTTPPEDVSLLSALVAMMMKTAEKCALTLKQDLLEEVITNTDKSMLVIQKCEKCLILVALDKGFDHETIRAKREKLCVAARSFS
jgi:AmiR/NasT family two-component response regulator